MDITIPSSSPVEIDLNGNTNTTRHKLPRKRKTTLSSRINNLEQKFEGFDSQLKLLLETVRVNATTPMPGGDERSIKDSEEEEDADPRNYQLPHSDPRVPYGSQLNTQNVLASSPLTPLANHPVISSTATSSHTTNIHTIQSSGLPTTTPVIYTTAQQCPILSSGLPTLPGTLSTAPAYPGGQSGGLIHTNLTSSSSAMLPQRVAMDTGLLSIQVTTKNEQKIWLGQYVDFKELAHPNYTPTLPPTVIQTHQHLTQRKMKKSQHRNGIKPSMCFRRSIINVFRVKQNSY